jgi:hypothetical protein
MGGELLAQIRMGSGNWRDITSSAAGEEQQGAPSCLLQGNESAWHEQTVEISPK